MATQPQHPATPPPAQPGVPPQHDQAQPEEKVLSKEEAKQLFLAGHRLRKKGDPPEKWIAAARVHNIMCLCRPLDPDLEKAELESEVVLVAD
jgi:hypothetical protein